VDDFIIDIVPIVACSVLYKRVVMSSAKVPLVILFQLILLFTAMANRSYIGFSLWSLETWGERSRFLRGKSTRSFIFPFLSFVN